MMGNGGYEGIGWLMGGGLMMLPMLLVWVAPLALVVWAATRLGGLQRPAAPDETPLEILRRRYARGEITQEEFERAKSQVA